jgi:hypothetical protein
MLDKFGGRKFVAFLIVLVCLAVFVLVGKIDAQTFITWATAGLAIYTAGNVGSDIAAK